MPSKLRLDKNYSSPMLLDDNQSTPIINIELQNNGTSVSEQVVVDSGDPDFYTISLNHLIANKTRQIFNVHATAYGSNTIGYNGQAEDTVDYWLKSPLLKINKAEFLNSSVNTTSDENSRIGSKLFDAGVTTFDYKNKLFYFEPLRKQSDNQKVTAQFTISPSYENGKLVVGKVWDDKLKQIVKRGDEIVKVNNVDTKTIDPCNILTHQTIFNKEIQLNLKVKSKHGGFRDVLIRKE